MSFKLLHVDASLPTAEAGESRERARDRVSVSHDAVQTISGFPRRVLNLITIWGPARTGKSFFMNILARDDNLFPVSGEAVPCTVGADMSTTIYDSSCFMREITQEESPTSSPMIGFVDVEGSGDKHVGYDVLLAIPLLILSKVVFFNWKGRVVKTPILESLARVAETARAIREAKRTNAFGHLVILLRDTPDEEEDAHCIIFDHETPDGPNDSEAAVSSRMERNETRERIKEAFQSVRVMCLPRPHKKIHESRIGREEVKDKFKAKIDQLREHLRGKLYDPHLVGGHALEGGDMFSSLLEEVCAAINHCDKDLVPVRMMETVIKREVEKCREEGVEQFEERIRDLEGSTSSSLETMVESMEGHRSTTLKNFREKTQGRSETVVQAAGTDLEKRLNELSEAWRVRHEETIASAKSRLADIMWKCHREIDHQDEELSTAVERAEESCVRSSSHVRVIETMKAATRVCTRNKTKEIIGKIPVDDDSELRAMWETASRSACEKMENEIRTSFPEGLRADLGLSSPFPSLFQQKVAAETDELMNLNRRMKEENDKHKAEMEELERRQMELQSQHENEEKAVDENLQAEREERKRKLEAAQNEVEDLRQRVEKCKQQASMNIFQHLGQFFEGMFTGKNW